jgi:hypothetical protein
MITVLVSYNIDTKQIYAVIVESENVVINVSDLAISDRFNRTTRLKLVSELSP